MPLPKYSKYAPLAHYLAAHPGDRVVLTLTEVEAILGVPLPAGARQRRWWLATQGRVSVRPLMQTAGWRLVLDGFCGRTPVVTFVWGGTDAAPAGRA